MSDGETPEEAIESGRDALWCVLKVYKEEGKPFPKVASEYSGKFVQRVPRFIHAELETTAAREGVSMNSLVQTFISHGLGMSTVKQRVNAVKPRMTNKTTKRKAIKKKA
jgi:antitoxin HicB